MIEEMTGLHFTCGLLFIEFPVGSKIKLEGKTVLEIVECEDYRYPCRNCVFFRTEACQNSLLCCASDRKDGLEVYFKRVEEK